ncbi:MAG: CAP domain-containing protein [Actinobacteria bacterium]|nr:CAP domain-containing protein [Actinomycetota bacterium]
MIGQNGAVKVASLDLADEQTCGISNFAGAMLSAVNGARAQARSCGGAAYGAAPALGWNELLGQASIEQATSMATANQLADTGSITDRATRTGYEFQAVGENIAQGYTSVPKLMEALLASDEHCRKIMSPAATEMAAACVKASTGKTYWAQTFAKHTPFE